MYLRTLVTIILIVSQVSFAHARKPAVEDFVGIEIEQPEQTPQGTESLFNFEKDMNEFEKNKGQALNSTKTDTSIQNSGPTPLTTTLGLIFLIGLPIMIWLMMMHHLRSKAAVESASNIAVLEKYRQQRTEAMKEKEAMKKAS